MVYLLNPYCSTFKFLPPPRQGSQKAVSLIPQHTVLCGIASTHSTRLELLSVMLTHFCSHKKQAGSKWQYIQRHSPGMTEKNRMGSHCHRPFMMPSLSSQGTVHLPPVCLSGPTTPPHSPLPGSPLVQPSVWPQWALILWTTDHLL